MEPTMRPLIKDLLEMIKEAYADPAFEAEYQAWAARRKEQGHVQGAACSKMVAEKG